MPDVTTKDVRKELPGAFQEVARGIGNFFVSSGQAQFRAYGATSAFVGNKLGLFETAQVKPVEQWEKDLFGTDKPFGLKEVGEEIPGVKGTIAPVVGFGLGVADLIPGGKITKSAVVGLLKNANKADDALRILTKLMGVSKEVAARWAPR